MNPRRIAIITGSRAEYGLLVPILRAVGAHPGLEAALIVTGMHLDPRQGFTADLIEADGFAIAARVPIDVPEPASGTGVEIAGDNGLTSARRIARGVEGMAEAIERLDPDAVLVLGDRSEIFAGATAAVTVNRILFHIHGGDRSQGGLDESYRHAITKLAHYHLTATAQSRSRVIQLGEPEARAFVVGAPGLDAILHETRLEPAAAMAALDWPQAPILSPTNSDPYLLVVQHPVSTHPQTAALEMHAVLDAVESSGLAAVILAPNSDPGGASMRQVIETRCLPQHAPRRWHFVASLPRETYLGLLVGAAALVGNSSSGIIEAPSLGVPTVDVGERQAGRERSAHVLSAGPEKGAILSAIRQARTPGFRAALQTAPSPYGDGTAGVKIADLLATLPIDATILAKQICY